MMRLRFVQWLRIGVCGETPSVARSARHFLFRLFVLVLLLVPAGATAILSQPDALLDSGPVQVKVNVEISEATKLFPKDVVRSHVEDRLEAAGVQVLRDGQELPGMVISGEHRPAEIWVNLAARRIAEPSGYLVTLEVSHVQTAILRRVRIVPVAGLDWQESWATIVRDDTDVLASTENTLDPLIDDFIKEFQAANRPPAPE